MAHQAEHAIAFARSNGFDSAQPYGDSGDMFMAVNYHADAINASNWAPLFDNTPHIIVANENGAQWRSEEDAIMLQREPKAF